MNVEMHDIHECCETFSSTHGYRRHGAQYLSGSSSLSLVWLVAQYADFKLAEQQADIGEVAPRASSNPRLQSAANQGLPPRPTSASAMPSAHDASGPSWPEVHCGIPKVRRS